MCETTQGHFAERHSFKWKPILSRPKKNLEATFHETMNHTKESHLVNTHVNKPWNVGSNEFVLAVTLLGKCLTYVLYMGIKPNYFAFT